MTMTAIVMPKSRPDVTQKGIDMIGDLRTDALHEALVARRSRTTC
jgi:ParB family chromosome partitioning protein